MTKFLLLNPLVHDEFGITTEEMIEAIEEFGCKVLTSLDTQGAVKYYATANSKETILQMCEATDLNGSVIEYTVVYDQLVEEV